ALTAAGIRPSSISSHTSRCSVDTTTPLDPSAPMKNRRGRKSDPAVPDFVERFRKLHGRTPTGAQIRTEFPDLPTSMAYDAAARASKTGFNSGLGLRLVGRAPK